MSNCFHILRAVILLITITAVSFAGAEQHKGPSMQSPETLNRLAKEKSPYLLQHARNPVDWYPWSEEAFEKARREDKPVFLSIGYSTCHWCHVMEEESFENDDIAKYLNEYYVAIKVDREERPDVDHVYMAAVQAMTGRGGWPLSIFLTPDKKPFFGGTYFPPFAKWGSPGFLDVLASIEHGWRNDRDKLIKSGNALTVLLAENVPGQSGAGELTPAIFARAFTEFQRTYDEQHGGFGNAPKFPTSHSLSFLLRYWNRERDEEALGMVTHTLHKMAAGGMYDHLGGGFHRYSTDREWQIPHFEKMLYDQAILARTYTEMYQITKDPFYARIARETLTYCLRDLRDVNGAFHSAEDADSLDPYEFVDMSPDPDQKFKKKEGAFFLWTHEQINQILSKEEAQVFIYYYDIRPDGNAKNDPHGEFGGRNVLAAAHSVEECSRKFVKTPEEIIASLDRSRAQLFPIREQRPRPHLDDKILVDWNGLIISSLAYAGRVLDEPTYVDAAEEAARFIIHNMISDGSLVHRYRDGEASIAGMLEDYAFFANALIDVYEATFDVTYLEKAMELEATMVRLFADDGEGGFYITAAGTQDLIYRPREVYDGALPSGNSVAALLMTRLYHISFDKAHFERAQRLFAAFAKGVSQRPSAYTQLLIAFDFAVGPAQEIVIAGAGAEAGLTAMADLVYQKFLPNRVLIHRNSDEQRLEAIVKIAPFVKNQAPIADKPTAYLCENYVCKKPTDNSAEFEALLKAVTQKE